MTHPDQLDAVRADRSLLPQAIEEALRFEPPLLTIARNATCEVEIARCHLEAGEGVTTHLGSANHDETRWETRRHSTSSVRPSRTSPSPTVPTCAWACTWPGWRLVSCVNRVLDRLDDLALEPGDSDPHIRGDIFRSPTALPVTFTRAVPETTASGYAEGGLSRGPKRFHRLAPSDQNRAHHGRGEQTMGDDTRHGVQPGGQQGRIVDHTAIVREDPPSGVSGASRRTANPACATSRQDRR